MTEVLRFPDLSTPRARVAAEVRAAMGRFGVSGNRLPGLLGKSQSYWSRRISGEVAFDVDDLAALADLLQVPVTVFFGQDAERPRPGGPDGGNLVRHQGLEPRTRWFGGSSTADHGRELADVVHLRPLIPAQPRPELEPAA